jgi:hypothetical protein
VEVYEWQGFIFTGDLIGFCWFFCIVRLLSGFCRSVFIRFYCWSDFVKLFTAILWIFCWVATVSAVFIEMFGAFETAKGRKLVGNCWEGRKNCGEGEKQ